MKRTILAAAFSAVAASVLTALLASAWRPAPVAPQGPPMSAADFKAALGDLEREMAALRREIGERSAAEPSAAVPWAASVAAGSDAGRGGAVEAFLARPARPLEGSPTAATLLGRFHEVVPRDEVEGGTDYRAHREQVRRWLFRSEREVLDWFGLPTSVNEHEGGGETWIYEVTTGVIGEDGEPETEEFWIRLNGGRVINLGN